MPEIDKAAHERALAEIGNRLGIDTKVEELRQQAVTAYNNGREAKAEGTIRLTPEMKLEIRRYGDKAGHRLLSALEKIYTKDGKTMRVDIVPDQIFLSTRLRIFVTIGVDAPAL